MAKWRRCVLSWWIINTWKKKMQKGCQLQKFANKIVMISPLPDSQGETLRRQILTWIISSVCAHCTSCRDLFITHAHARLQAPTHTDRALLLPARPLKYRSQGRRRSKPTLTVCNVPWSWLNRRHRLTPAGVGQRVSDEPSASIPPRWATDGRGTTQLVTIHSHVSKVAIYKCCLSLQFVVGVSWKTPGSLFVLNPLTDVVVVDHLPLTATDVSGPNKHFSTTQPNLF